MTEKAKPVVQKPAKTGKPAVKKNPAQTTEHSKTLSNILGEIIWLMTRSANHRYFFISDLEWMVLQPVSLGQFRVFHGEDFPVGVLFWGFVNEAVEERIKQGVTRLSPGDWKSGDRLWLIDAITPFGNVQQMLDDLTKNVFPDRPYQYMQRDEAGKLVARSSQPIQA
ncbi:MAG: toxin-activating lysine-acyltransferase [bacterium]